MKVLNSLDEAFQYATQLWDNTVEFEQVSFPAESYSYKIQIKGNTWSKYIDIRHAKYISCLQDAYIDFASDIFDVTESIDSYIRVCVSDGSSDMEHEIKGFLQKAAEKMTDKQVFCSIMFAIAMTGGYFMFDSYIKSNTEVQKADVDKARLEVFRDMHEKSLTAISQIAMAERPIRTLANMMEENDSLIIDDSKVFISRDNIKKNLQQIKRSASKIAYCDGDYQLQKIDFSLGEMILYVKKDGVQIKAYTTMLDDNDDKKLSQMVEEKRKIEDLPFSIPLQMNVEYTEKRVKYGTIVGIGSPRPDKDNKPLNTVVEK